MSLTFVQFKQDVFASAFPAGEPERLKIAHRKDLVAALIAVQRYCPALQLKHRNVTLPCGSYFWCGATVVAAPRGVLRRVYTLPVGKECCPIYYSFESNFGDFRNRLHYAVVDYDPPANDGLPALDNGFQYHEASLDKGYRSDGGWYCIDQGWIYLMQRIESTERVVAEWRGVKRQWLDNDLMPLAGDRDEVAGSEDQGVELADVCEAYVLAEHLRKFGGDLAGAREQMTIFQARRAEFIRSFKHEDTPEPEPEETYTPIVVASGCADLAICEAATAEADDGQVFAVIGDFGTDNTDAPEEVAALVKSWNPQFIATVGDNVQEDSGGADYEDLVRPLYGEFITRNLATNKFFPAIGNHDLSDAGLADFRAFFTLPSNEQNYSVRRGFVELFFIDSNARTSPYSASDVGYNDSDSPQAKWLEARLQLSNAPWKIVLWHHPAYSSGGNGNNTWMRWPDVKAWGADLVLNGHFHVYERLLTADGLTRITCGLGGYTLHTFGTVSDYSQYRYASAHGALKCRATCKQLVIEPINTSESVIETVTLEKNT